MNVQEPRNVSMNIKHNVEVQLPEIQMHDLIIRKKGTRASLNLKEDKYSLTFFFYACWAHGGNKQQHTWGLNVDRLQIQRKYHLIMQGTIGEISLDESVSDNKWQEEAKRMTHTAVWSNTNWFYM